MDVDGTLTDGKIYMGSNGELFKAFDVKDGYGIHNILPKYNINAAFLTGRISEIVNRRAEELGVKHVIQNSNMKADAVKELANKENCSLSEIAYIGDDITDLDAMKICGIKGCPSNAAQAVKDAADYVTQNNGGQSCVREFIEWIISKLS